MKIRRCTVTLLPALCLGLPYFLYIFAFSKERTSDWSIRPAATLALNESNLSTSGFVLVSPPRRGDDDDAITPDVVPPRCVATNPRWMACMQRAGPSIGRRMSLCAAYRLCDEELRDVDGYDESCKRQVPVSPERRVACCVDLWWSTNVSRSTELRHAFGERGLMARHLSKHCAVNVEFFEAGQSAPSSRNDMGGLEGTVGRLVLVQLHLSTKKYRLPEILRNARLAGADRVGAVVNGDEYSFLPSEVYSEPDFLFRNYADKRDNLFLRHFSRPDSDSDSDPASGRLVLVTSPPPAWRKASSPPAPAKCTDLSGSSCAAPADVATKPSLNESRDGRRIYWLPLMYTDRAYMDMAALAASRPASSRRHLWYFSGWNSSPSRAEMMRVLASDPFLRDKGVAMTTTGWANGGGHQYAKQMLDTVFALSPRGTNHETFRTWEAIAFGAIPVLQDKAMDHPERSPYRFYGKHPLPVVRSWTELPALLQFYSEHPIEMDRLQQDCMAWWNDLSDAYSRQLAGEALALFGSKSAGRSTAF